MPMEKNKLLIVDDDIPNLMELTHILQSEYKIYTAKDGVSAIERARISLPDLILLDIIMPDMNGFEVLEELKKDELTKEIPVIFITGINDKTNESEGLAVGAVDYIRKPFDPMVVQLRVRHQIQIVNLKREMLSSAKTAEMANRTKSVFLANMSHEIRTPMNVILGVTEILIQNETLSEETEEGLSKIYSSCDLLLGIINDILDFSKIEAGKLDLMPNLYQVASMINDSVHLNMMRVEGKPIEFELQIDENVPAKLFGDEIRIKQIFNNLLSNAFKYTDSGTVTLSIQAKPYKVSDEEESETDWIMLVISVCDTGHGMTKEQLEKMFDEYARFNNNKGKTIEGTGLGLAITQSLVSLMKGRIQVESEPGKGSLFTIYLPQKIIDKEFIGKDVVDNLKQFRSNYIKSMKRGQIVRDPMPYGNILIVDDVETNIYVAVNLMRLYKLNIETAKNGFKAIDLVKEGKVYDVIFMDHMMPEMDGIETTKRIRELGYKAPIVGLTANAVVGQADIFLNSGFDDFISKPIDIRRLNVVLNKFVRDKQPSDVIDAARKQYGGKPFTVSAHPDDAQQPDLLLLESFIRDASKAIAWLDLQCSQPAGTQLNLRDVFKDTETLRMFTVIIHGIKSSLWNINEKELAELALQLEIAGRDKNIDLLGETTPDFINKLSGLLKNLKEERSRKNEEIESCDEDKNELKEKMAEIKKMAADYDRKGILNVIAQIKRYSKETKAMLDSISQNAIHSDFEEAEKIAADYIGGA